MKTWDLTAAVEHREAGLAMTLPHNTARSPSSARSAMFIAPEIIHDPAKLRRSGMAGPRVEFRIGRGRTCRSYGARRIVIGDASYKHGAPNGAFFLRQDPCNLKQA